LRPASVPQHRARGGVIDLVRKSLALSVVLLVMAACMPAASTSSSARRQPVTLPSEQPIVLQSQQPITPTGPSRLVWRFTQTLLQPSDANTLANVLLDIEPVLGGGWVIVQDRAPVRRLSQGGASGGPFLRAGGTVLRLDSSGAIAARQPVGDPFAPTHLVLFERSGVVVAEGAGTRGLDLQSLDTLWATDAECVAVGERCYAYQPQVLPPPGAVDVRDPRTFSVVQGLPHVKVGQLMTPMILPDWNLAIVRSIVPDRPFDFFPVDPSAAIALPWIDRLRQAKSIGLISADRMLVSYEGWGLGRFPKSELLDVPSGHVIKTFDWLPAFTNNSVTYLQGPSPLQVLDPRDAANGPTLPTLPLYVNLESGIVVVPLGNGGAAVLRREMAPGGEYAVPVTKIAEGSCAEIAFTRVQLADGTADCAGLTGAAGPRRILVSIGRERDTDSFEITRVSVDEAARRITIGVKIGDMRSASIAQRAPTQVIELPESLRGRWLVGLEPEPANPRPFGFHTAFALEVR
jgi:hypothetical protein